MLASRLLARAAAPLLLLAAVACQDPGDPKSGSTPTGTAPGTPTATGCPEGQQDNAGPGLCLPTCETSGVVCGANATCSDATGLAECFCDERFQDNDGDGDCSLDCASSPPCTANATCSDDSGEATCACDPLYQDHDGNGSCEPTCLLAALDCGHGACADASGTPTCACEPEYTGAGCELCASGFQDHDGDGVCVEDCATSGLDCGLNGACDDSAGEATCACDLGYAGAACETCALGYQDDDGDGTCSADCATSGLDCGAHGACHTASGVAACACDALFTGATCDSCVPGYQDDDGDGVCEADCATAALDCGTHGACSTATGTAGCACDFGWTGPTCTPIPSDGHFVDDDAAPGGDGNTWETAFTSVQDAILAPGWRYKVYVKEGTYTAVGTDPVAELPQWMDVYGGFAQDLEGTLADLDGRDLAAHETVFDGAGTSANVVVMGDETVLDGVTVTGGYTQDWLGGAGVFVYNVDDVLLQSVRIVGNTVAGIGGIAGRGGGLVCDTVVGLTVADSEILDNVAWSSPTNEGFPGYGGGIHASNCTMTLARTTVAGNQALGVSAPMWTGTNGIGAAGGGLNAVFSTVLLDDVLFDGNQAIGGAGSDGWVFSGPQAGGRGGSANGGAIHIAYSTVTGTVTLTNNSAIGGRGGNGSIEICTDIWSTAPGAAGGNGANAGGGAVWNGGSFFPTGMITANVAQGGVGGNGGTYCSSGPAGSPGSAYGGGIDAWNGGGDYTGATVTGNTPDNVYP